MIFTSLVATFFLVFTLLLLYSLRPYILPHLPASFVDRLPPFIRNLPDGSSASGSGGYGYVSLPNPVTWAQQRAAGLHSSLFDIEANITDLDARTGLDERGAEEIRRLMEIHGVSFDEARLMRNKAHMERNAIDPRTGMPLDAKAVTFEGLRR